jgi:hypothetical protein
MTMIFIDHYSKLKYILLTTRLTSEETMEAKHLFEHFAKRYGICILHYHCNNGCFANNSFKSSYNAKGQHLTFCGINANF